MIHIGVFARAREGNGGTLLYTRSMIEALAYLDSAAYKITVITEPDNHEYDALGQPIARTSGIISLLVRRLFRRKPLYDVDVILSPVYSISLLFYGKPFAFTLHDLQERHFPQNFSLSERLWRRLTNWLLSRRASRIICESEFVRNDIVTYIGVDAEKVIVIPAPPISMLKADLVKQDAVDAVRAKFLISKKYIFYPAQFWPHKNHIRLVEAFYNVLQQHPDCALVLTGKKRDEYANVMSKIHSLSIAKSVCHIGYVDLVDLASLYKGATILVMPTLFESISIPVYEAFSMRCAVCAANVVALPEQIGDAGLLFDPLSVDDIAEKIKLLLNDSNLREHFIGNGHRRLENLTLMQYSNRLSSLVDCMLK